MNIYTSRGSKVLFLNVNGYDEDPKYATDSGLVKGGIYTVDHVDVGSWRSTVALTEFPGQSFNTVMFDDVELCTRVNIKSPKFKLDIFISQLEDLLSNFSDNISLTRSKFQELDSIKELVNNFKKEI